MNSRPRDGGFGMIEIVVSMLLLSLLAIAFLPMLVTALRVSVSNASLSTATQLVSTQMSELRALGTTCAVLETYGNNLPSEFDAGGRKFSQTIEIDCPASDYPAKVPVTVSVSASDPVPMLAEATTLIFVTG
ncbi:type IV pilus modification PilV family protein [Cryobacterium serini]|uniref:Type II secretion system protein n=1 Tax=Cryobacterium serini TaxID=1259201 RepID=A0A4R9BQ19_9MICO|nr:hypothetical protein [Cryobacterium serini]TFD87759.1 hypothetical protein E3T51_09805 [Cryobacterium serini]